MSGNINPYKNQLRRVLLSVGLGLASIGSLRTFFGADSAAADLFIFFTQISKQFPPTDLKILAWVWL